MAITLLVENLSQTLKFTTLMDFLRDTLCTTGGALTSQRKGIKTLLGPGLDGSFFLIPKNIINL